MQWLYQARKRYGVTVLDYIVTSNHIHLLVKDDGDEGTISRFIQLVAGRTGQEYNQRKNRRGAFWEDRYHATAIENGDHFLRCLVYIDLNMVRAGVVEHPAQWLFSGYNEIQKPRRKNVLINYDKLMEALGVNSYEAVKETHKTLVEESLNAERNRLDEKWTKSIAVGSKGFVEDIKSVLGGLANGRNIQGTGATYQLREPSPFYNGFLRGENDNIGGGNMYQWDFNEV